MDMRFEKLIIGLKNEFSAAGPNNPYQAKLQVSYNDNQMTVALSEDACARILALAGEEIAAAAQVQIRDFVAAALSVSKTPMIEGTVS